MRHDSASTNMGHARGVVAACHHAAVWAAVLWGGGAYGQGLPAATTLPQGGIVVGNTATIGQPVVTGSTAALTVNQTADRAIINWSSFNVGSGASVNFVQPGTGAMVLNRVTGGETSAIAGKISANGTFILENPSGAILYNGAQVSAQSVIITPSHLSDSNFNSGILSFTAPTGSSVATPAVTVGQGATITAGDAGLVGLVAPQVSNAGTITANLGTILLAGGAKAYTIDLYGDGLINFQITDAVGAGEVASDALLVTNTSTGRLSAPRGSVQLTAQAADGVVKKLISAGGQISAPSTDQGNGEVSIEGIGGDITIAGNLLAQGSDSVSGGLVTVSATGGAVSTQAASRIDTTGYGTSSSVSIASDRAGTLAGTITTPGQVAIGGSSQVTSGGVIDAGSVDVIAGAMLALSGSGQLASAPQMVVDGTFDISGASSGITASALYGAGTVALGGQALTLTGATTGMEVPADTGFDGSLTDGGLAGGTGGSLVLGGSATQILTGASTYTGPTVIGSGASLLLQGNGSITPSSTVVADGTFDISDMAATQVTALSGSGTVALGAGVLGVSNATGTFAGTLADGGTWGGAGGSLVVNGGTQTLTGQNTLTGGITVNNATLAISGDGALGFSPGGLTLSNGTLRTLAGMTLDHTITLAGSGGTIDTYGQDISFSNMISGSGGLVVTDSTTTGGGGLTLAGANTYTGSTTVAAPGLLALAGGGSIAPSDNVIVDGMLDIAGASGAVSLRSLAGSGQAVLGGNRLVLEQAGGTFSGVLSGTAGSLVVAAGSESLTGDNLYTGTTTLTPGATLQLGDGGSAGSVAGPVVNNGTLVLDHNADFTLGTAITGNGQILIEGGGTLGQAADASITQSRITTGGSVFDGAIVLDGNNTIPTLGNLMASGPITVRTSGALDIAGTISTPGTLTLQAGGTLGQGTAGTISAGVLTTGTGAVGGDTLLTGANRIGTLGRFVVTDGQFQLDNATALTLDGPLAAHAVNMTAAGSLTLGAGGSLFLSPRSVTDTSTLAVTGNGAAVLQPGGFSINAGTLASLYTTVPATLTISVAGTGAVTLGGAGGQLVAPTTSLVLRLGDQVTLGGNVNLLSLALYGAGAASLTGRLDGMDGAQAATVAQAHTANAGVDLFNGCAFGSVNCGVTSPPDVTPQNPVTPPDNDTPPATNNTGQGDTGQPAANTPPIRAIPSVSNPLSGYEPAGMGPTAGVVSGLLGVTGTQPRDALGDSPLFSYSARPGRGGTTDSSPYMPGVAGQDY